MDVKYPNINVKLIGKDGNAFSILGKVTKALRRNNISDEEIKQFNCEAMSGDYDHLLITVMKWINVE